MRFQSSTPKLFFITLALFIVAHNSIGQPENFQHENVNLKKLKARAKHALKTGDTYTALFYYEEAAKIDTLNPDTYYELAELHRLSKNYVEAEKNYKIAFDKNNNRYPMALLYQGIMQKMNGNPEEAKITIQQFRKQFRKLGDKFFKRYVGRQLYGCDSAISFKEFPQNIEVKNLGHSVNHPHLEFSPINLDSTTLIYGSLRVDTFGFYDVSYDHPSRQPQRQIYYAKKDNGEWLDQGLFDKINDTTMEMGNFIYSNHSKKWYFTKCYYDNHHSPICKIYSLSKPSRKEKNPVPELMPRPINVQGYSSTQPAIFYDSTKKKEYFYFVSDRPEGKGGKDIWYTFYHRKKKSWQGPYNMGGTINTPQTECTPFFDQKTKTFYYSSNGYYSAGGLDIFKTHKNGRRYVKPQNLGFPINSPQDDLDFYLSPDDSTGFFTSNRPGGHKYFHETCCDDIYSFKLLPPKPFNCDMEVEIEKPDSVECQKSIFVKVLDLKSKKERMDTVKVEDCKFIVPLSKHQRYTVVVNDLEYKIDSLVVTTRESAASDKIFKKLKLERKPPVVVELPTEKPTEENPFVLNDLHYETNQAALTPKAKSVLDTLLVPYLKLHSGNVIISAHTDSKGSKKYNQSLSQRRAQNVVNHLIKRGIKKDRLIAKGYGESKPMAPNENPDGTDNLVNQSLNRRTEISFQDEKKNKNK